MTSPILLLPHQLYDCAIQDRKIILWEHPHYFCEYKYNKKRLILHRASMQKFYDKLKNMGIEVDYITYRDDPPSPPYVIYDIIDKLDNIEAEEIWDSPNFLFNRDILKKYNEKYSGFRFSTFYKWAKKHLKFLEDVESQDKFNRKGPSKELKTPPMFKTEPDPDYVKSAIEYLSADFADNYGEFSDFNYPITREDALIELDYFFKTKLNKFGPYQDAISTKSDTMFHSCLSAVINIGLLHPSEILEKLRNLKDYYLPSYEGYFRQLLWREYQRLCYYHYNLPVIEGDYEPIPDSWYSGETGITPVDDAIKDAFRTGYLHHIRRLMIIGSFMFMTNKDPVAGHKWFMEFSCDSYHWVMYQNVFEMVFAVGRDTMTRSYMSSGSYVLKMSDYKKEDWVDHWTLLFRRKVFNLSPKQRWPYVARNEWKKEIENYSKGKYNY